MAKGKLFEVLNNIYGSETELNMKMENKLKEAREAFLKLDAKDDDELRDHMYKWFQEQFGAVD